MERCSTSSVIKGFHTNPNEASHPVLLKFKTEENQVYKDVEHSELSYTSWQECKNNTATLAVLAVSYEGRYTLW